MSVNKKVGIVTFHFPHNYGAMLQAYSMQEILLNMGYDASIIDYEPYYHKKTYNVTHFKDCFEWSPIRTLRHIVGYLLRFPTEIRRYNNFESFKLNRMRLTPYLPTKDYSEFDYILLGSDQIWNQALTNNCFDGPYYGEGFKSKVFSYAASSKYKELAEDIKLEFKNKLKGLFAIGVREESLKNLLQPLTDKIVSVNLDPSLIVDASTLSKLRLKRPVKSKYVLVYELNPHSEVAEMAKNYADHIGAKVITLVAYFDWKRRFGRCDQEASPEKFLSYIKNAECIFTTSFHGTAFSIVFQKPFYVVRQNNNSDLRIESLMTQLGLDSNFVAMESRPTNCSINYQKVALRLEALRANSINYLNDCLNS